MNILSALGHAFLGGVQSSEVVAARHATDFPSYEEQIAAIWSSRGGGGTWRTGSVDDALGSPAIFGAVALITNTIATLSFEAFRNGVKLPQEQAPRIIQRPDPFTTLRAFLQKSAFYLVSRGELPWWVAKRDPLDDSPMSVIAVPPWELTREEGSSRLRPIWRWGDTVIPNEDLKLIQYLPGRSGRGFGPLQKCGAAVSVAVESEQWAANFFSGALPSIIGTTEQDMTGPELEQLDKQWLEKPPNLPRWMTNGITMSDAPYDPEKAQLRDIRDANVGDAARMFNIPGGLIEYTMAGSSLTYKNDETVWADFQKRCLGPHYMEPMEQEMSDLLTRSTVARFNAKQLLRGSATERMGVHTAAIAAGIYSAETAAQEEGYAPGAVDFAPVPLALPQAVPTRLPIDSTPGPTSSTPPLTLAALGAGRSSMADLRCPKCGWLAGRVAGFAEIKCRKCDTMVVA